MKSNSLLFIIFALMSMSCTEKKTQPTSEEVIEIIHKVNNYWQTNNPKHGNAFWHRAVYHTGNMAAYALTEKAEYADLYTNEPADYKIARARGVMEYQMSTPNNDYWWWADGLYMVMPVMTRLHKITGNELYLEKLYEYLMYADSIMYDVEAGLYYRDAKYIYPKHESMNGKKDFWARGDGWVLAAFARVLQDFPEDHKDRSFYVERFRTIAKAVAACQQPEGYWTRSMLDPEHAPGPETSGTAFFTYGILWGVNNGLLDKKEYKPIIDKAWTYLSTVALQEDGKVGYVQPIGEKAIPGQVVDANSQADFGVGAFLLAACEMAKYVTQ